MRRSNAGSKFAREVGRKDDDPLNDLEPVSRTLTTVFDPLLGPVLPSIIGSP